jgi:hypothetical protein
VKAYRRRYTPQDTSPQENAYRSDIGDFKGLVHDVASKDLAVDVAILQKKGGGRANVRIGENNTAVS